MPYQRRSISSTTTNDQLQLQKASRFPIKSKEVFNLHNPTIKLYKTARSQFFNKYKFHFNPNQIKNTKKKTSNLKGSKKSIIMFQYPQDTQRYDENEKEVLDHYTKILNRFKKIHRQLIYYGQYLKIPSFKNTINYQFYQFSFKYCVKLQQKLDRYLQLLTCIVKNQKQIQKMAKKVSSHFISLNEKPIKNKNQNEKVSVKKIFKNTQKTQKQQSKKLFQTGKKTKSCKVCYTGKLKKQSNNTKDKKVKILKK